MAKGGGREPELELFVKVRGRKNMENEERLGKKGASWLSSSVPASM